MVINCFNKIISLNNLPRANPTGQVATLLILMIAAVLIFILVTVNLGTISLSTTNLSNATDSASLYLGSQLSTKARMLWESLDQNTEKCKKGGLASIIFAVVLAIVAVVITVVTAGAGAGFAAGLANVSTATLTGVGAAAGAVGGAIGGAYAGTGVLQGALQGAMIGASIGGAVSMMGGSTATVNTAGAAASEGSTATVSLAEGGQITGTVVSSGGEIGGTATVWDSAGLAWTGCIESLTMGSVSIMGATTGITLAASSALYNAYVADQMTSAAFAAAAKALNGLPEYDRYRESVFLQALSQTIDDPNKTADINDSDGDGDIQEMIPYFQYWWDRRTTALKNVFSQLSTLTDGFVNGPLGEFGQVAYEQYTSTCSGSVYNQTCEYGSLVRQGVDDSEIDGGVVELARALEDAGYDLSFYQSGTPPSDNSECDECNPDDYYDEIDAVVSKLKNFVGLFEGDETNAGLLGYNIDQLTSTWQSWIKWLYDPNSKDDYYDTLETLIKGEDLNGDGIYGGEGEFKGLEAWKAEIEAKRIQLPQCEYGHGYCFGEDGEEGGTECIINPPCQDDYSGSIDTYSDDEFQAVYSAIDNLILKIQTFRTATVDFYNNMNKAYEDAIASVGIEYGGINPIVYKWTDSRGEHSITTEASPFKLAYIATKSSGSFLKKEVCLQLKDYYDDSGASTWIKITRQDPADKDVGIIGKWNPKFSGMITKLSKAYYSYDRVGIIGIK